MKYGLMSVLFPPRCGGCGTLLKIDDTGVDYSAFCADCADIWESELLDSCGGCGLAVSECACRAEEIVRVHGAGLWKRVYYLQGKKYPPQNRILYKIKRQKSALCIAFLAAELERSLERLIADTNADPALVRLTYFPRSKHSARECGTDQGKELAQALSRRTSIPCEPIIRRYPHMNTQQKTLSHEGRRRNALASYYLDPKAAPAGKIYILVDDIVTTGSTMAAGIRLLRDAGASSVYCLAVAVDDANKNAALRQPQFKI